MNHSIAIGIVSRTLEVLLSRLDKPVAFLDRTTGTACPVTPDLAAAPDGLLPVFLVAGDAVWRDATDKSFGIGLLRDPQTLLGFRAAGISGGPFSSVMLSMLEAIDQTARPRMILVNDFDGLWRSIERGFQNDIRAEYGATLSPRGF
jgi:hypothetical protein